MEAFSLEDAKAGAQVCYKNGEHVSVVFFDECRDVYHVVFPQHTRGSWVKGYDLGMGSV